VTSAQIPTRMASSSRTGRKQSNVVHHTVPLILLSSERWVPAEGGYELDASAARCKIGLFHRPRLSARFVWVRTSRTFGRRGSVISNLMPLSVEM